MKNVCAYLYLVAVIIGFGLPVAAFADTTPPTISGATTITAEATGAAGASVTFSVTATDATGTPITASCTPASGSTFALGTTTVGCSATDELNVSTSTSFDVIVHDTTAPHITPPADQSFATTTFPASPTLVPATATDAVDANPAITYSPQSFALGMTTVTWNATDMSGNSSATTSLVVITDSSASSSSATSTLDLEIHADVPSMCTATDTDAVAHDYAASSSSEYLGICAVEAAIASSTLTDVAFSNQYPALGLFVTAINNVAADPSSEYWALYLNGSFAQSGLTSLPIAAGDTIQFQLHDFSDNDLGDRLTLDIDSLIATSSEATSSQSQSSGSSGNPGGGGGGPAHSQLNIVNAFSFLASHQNADGSFGTPENIDITDWAAIACGVPTAPAAPCAKLRSYELTASPALSSATDYERHAMALEALGINPYSGTPVNYIAPIVADFNGTSITGPVQGDVFALFSLIYAGFDPNDPMIQKIGSYILSQQQPNGSWGDPDTTAAAIQGLGLLFSAPNTNVQTLGQDLGAAQGYLVAGEQSDGSWSNVDSTSWVLTMANAVNAEDPAHANSWTSSQGLFPSDAIAQAQQPLDGGVQASSVATDSRVWSTTYAIVAASGQSWLSILKQFSQLSGNIGGGGGGAGGIVLGASTSTVATSTLPVATSTPAVATTTPEISGTSTPPLITAATTTATSTPIRTKKTPVKKPTTPGTVTPTETTLPTPTVSSQTAAAGTTSGGNFIGGIWHAIASFFAHLF